MSKEIIQVTKEQAIALFEGKFYEGMTKREIAEFQLFQDRLCMPFSVFNGAMEDALGRPVWTHEFAFRDEMTKEFLGEKAAPSFDDILNLIPANKRILITI